jgi:hypothetical protein
VVQEADDEVEREAGGDDDQVGGEQGAQQASSSQSRGTRSAGAGGFVFGRQPRADSRQPLGVRLRNALSPLESTTRAFVISTSTRLTAPPSSCRPVTASAQASPSSWTSAARVSSESSAQARPPVCAS